MSLVQGRLPQWAPAATLLPASAAAAAVTLLAGLHLVAFVVLTLVAHAALLGASSIMVEGTRRARDRMATQAVTAAFAIAMVPLVSVAWTVVQNGIARFDVQFFTYSMRGVVGAGGGAYHAITGTLIVTALAALISVPFGVLAAVYLVEYGRGRLARALTFLVDVMTGIPSIVAGLFAVSLFTLLLGPGTRFGVVGAVALSVLMLPIVIRSTEEMLKLVPNDLREAAYALGVPKWRTIVKVVLPTSIAGITTGVTLAVARIIGETAPLLVTVGLVTGTNLNPFDGRMATLPVFSYYSYTQPGVPPGSSIDRAWTAALVLIAIVMALNLIARLVSRRFAARPGH
jgi:phosphate transport system permease protein